MTGRDGSLKTDRIAWRTEILSDPVQCTWQLRSVGLFKNHPIAFNFCSTLIILISLITNYPPVPFSQLIDMCVLLDCCLYVNTAWQLDYLITWLLWCGAWSVFQWCLATTMLPNHATITPCYHTIMLLCYCATCISWCCSAYLWSRFPPAWWQVTRWSKDGRRWPRDEKRRKVPTSFQHLRERPPSWQSGPDQVQYSALLLMQIQILPEPTQYSHSAPSSPVASFPLQE